MKPVILAPRRDDNGWRDRLWEFCRAWWDEHHGIPIYEGHDDDDGPFNRSKAINLAAAAAGDWDVALIIDCDVISNRDAVRSALEIATTERVLTVAHNQRFMLNKATTARILDGYRGPWTRPGMFDTVYHDSVSCAVAVSRDVWELVGGFDERFVGWGYEDSAFQMAVETLTGNPLRRVTSDCHHLWHPKQDTADPKSVTLRANRERLRRYERARWDPDAIQAVLDDGPPQPADWETIPRILHRTVPEVTSDAVERWWDTFVELHPAWDCKTWREPIDPADFPLTGDLFDRCQNGAQKAGLIRLEILYTYGGVYVDSDCVPYRPLDPLLQTQAFAGWEDETTVPDAVLGARPQHPAWKTMIVQARRSIENGGDAWTSGPGVTTTVLPDRPDVVLLPPGAFYPAHYLEKHALGSRTDAPWVYLEHQWQHSWATPGQRNRIASRQRR